MARRKAKKGSRKQSRRPRGEMDTSRAMTLYKSSVPRLILPQQNNTKMTPRQGGLTSVNSTGLHEAICSQTDPFCSHAVGAKVLSGSSGTLSGTVQERVIIPLTTDANGNVGILICNSVYNTWSTLTTSAAGAITAASAFNSMPVWTTLGGTTTSASVRTASWGFKYNYTGSDYSNQGVKYAARLPYNAASSVLTGVIGITPNVITYQPESSISRVPTPLIYVGRPPSTMAKEAFVNIGSTQNNDDTLPWDGIVYFQVIGAQASTNIGYIEAVYNLEYTLSLFGPAAYSALSKTMTPSSTINGDRVSHLASRVITGLNMFYESLPIERFSALIAQKASQAIASSLGRGVRMLM